MKKLFVAHIVTKRDPSYDLEVRKANIKKGL
jgi:hypothetical protein